MTGVAANSIVRLGVFFYENETDRLREEAGLSSMRAFGFANSAKEHLLDSGGDPSTVDTLGLTLYLSQGSKAAHGGEGTLGMDCVSDSTAGRITFCWGVCGSETWTLLSDHVYLHRHDGGDSGTRQLLELMVLSGLCGLLLLSLTLIYHIVLVSSTFLLSGPVNNNFKVQIATGLLKNRRGGSACHKGSKRSSVQLRPWLSQRRP